VPLVSAPMLVKAPIRRVTFVAPGAPGAPADVRLPAIPAIPEPKLNGVPSPLAYSDMGYVEFVRTLKARGAYSKANP
jgi:hypothetical protein